MPREVRKKYEQIRQVPKLLNLGPQNVGLEGAGPPGPSGSVPEGPLVVPRPLANRWFILLIRLLLSTLA